jgi:hypothetical protein
VTSMVAVAVTRTDFAMAADGSAAAPPLLLLLLLGTVDGGTQPMAVFPRRARTGRGGRPSESSDEEQ